MMALMLKIAESHQTIVAAFGKRSVILRIDFPQDQPIGPLAHAALMALFQGSANFLLTHYLACFVPLWGSMLPYVLFCDELSHRLDSVVYLEKSLFLLAGDAATP